ncbi:hypothetical protein DFP72DRAFT_933178 [Ephemerocybe angulata]|uniref:Uncharacterized protein n=1 Tax=Ephemerocybe angulata TaxID=980116 RepID=A0A8H6LVA2_9AGAR|nr:hypothetical protein DFP72DRAFT_933178 [Tulosesus angulatus]
MRFITTTRVKTLRYSKHFQSSRQARKPSIRIHIHIISYQLPKSIGPREVQRVIMYTYAVRVPPLFPKQKACPKHVQQHMQETQSISRNQGSVKRLMKPSLPTKQNINGVRRHDRRRRPSSRIVALLRIVLRHLVSRVPRIQERPHHRFPRNRELVPLPNWRSEREREGALSARRRDDGPATLDSQDPRVRPIGRDPPPLHRVPVEEMGHLVVFFIEFLLFLFLLVFLV